MSASIPTDINGSGQPAGALMLLQHTASISEGQQNILEWLVVLAVVLVVVYLCVAPYIRRRWLDREIHDSMRVEARRMGFEWCPNAEEYISGKALKKQFKTLPTGYGSAECAHLFRRSFDDYEALIFEYCFGFGGTSGGFAWVARTIFYFRNLDDLTMLSLKVQDKEGLRSLSEEIPEAGDAIQSIGASSRKDLRIETKDNITIMFFDIWKYYSTETRAQFPARSRRGLFLSVQKLFEALKDCSERYLD